MQHFILKQDFSGDRVAIQDKELLHQLRNVLRFRVGEECILMNGQGTQARARIEELHSKEVVLRVEKHEVTPAPGRKLRLCCALSKKPATFELIVQKATELGVTDIFPLVTQRCQTRDLRKSERLLLIIKEACEQCERAYLPTLHPALSMDELLKNLPSGKLLAGDPWTYDARLADIRLDEGEAINIVIGPEGGLSPEELQSIRQKGGTIFILGKEILRMETAAIAALSMVQFGSGMLK